MYVVGVEIKSKEPCPRFELGSPISLPSTITATLNALDVFMCLWAQAHVCIDKRICVHVCIYLHLCNFICTIPYTNMRNVHRLFIIYLHRT